MTTRDELEQFEADVIDALEDASEVVEHHRLRDDRQIDTFEFGQMVTGRLVGHGYRKPRTITTEDFDELLLLPMDSIVMETENPQYVFQKAPEGWLEFGTDAEYDINSIELPVTVLYVPEELA